MWRCCVSGRAAGGLDGGKGFAEIMELLAGPGQLIGDGLECPESSALCWCGGVVLELLNEKLDER